VVFVVIAVVVGKFCRWIVVVFDQALIYRLVVVVPR
jgi:hypothetical protein